MIRHASDATTQDVFPVVDGAGNMVGLVTTDIMRVLAAEITDTRWTLAADLMQPVVSVHAQDDAKTAMQRLIDNGLREIPVVGADGRVVGMLDESDIAAVYLLAATRAESQDDVAPDSVGS
jgi:CIC family chloride channel protein